MEESNQDGTEQQVSSQASEEKWKELHEKMSQESTSQGSTVPADGRQRTNSDGEGKNRKSETRDADSSQANTTGRALPPHNVFTVQPRREAILRRASSLSQVPRIFRATTSENTNKDGEEKTQAAQRKRSRTGEMATYEDQGKRIDELLLQVQGLIEQVVRKGDKGKTIMDKINLGELMRELSQKFVSSMAYTNTLASKIITCYEEKAELQNKLQASQEETNALQQQVISLQHQQLKQGGAEQQTALNTYLKVASRNIVAGKQLPIPNIPETVKMAPSEKILIFRAMEKGILPTKMQEEEFRRDLAKALGNELMRDIVVIRQTRYGGHTAIFQSEESRNEALQVLRMNEIEVGIDEKTSNLTAPKKKVAKMVCRRPPDNFTSSTVLQDMYGKNNAYLHQIPVQQRTAKIIESTALGWIFELTSEEAAACHAQNGRICFGYARELRVEEFIPLQQCYKCCMFGHNAGECLSEKEYCRLCGIMGHSGKDCNFKNNKSAWSCINCKITNDVKGFKLPTDHAAAQLHKCPCALNQKLIKKEQLAAAGIFTTPISEESLYRKQAKIHTTGGQTIQGAQSQYHNQKKGQRIKSRSKSQRRNKPVRNENLSAATSTTASVRMRDFNISSTTTAAPSNIDLRNVNISSIVTNGTEVSSQYGAHFRAPQAQRPRSTEGWKYVGRQRGSEGSESRGRLNEEKQMGTNSTSSLMRPSQQQIDTQMS